MNKFISYFFWNFLLYSAILVFNSFVKSKFLKLSKLTVKVILYAKIHTVEGSLFCVRVLLILYDFLFKQKVNLNAKKDEQKE